MSAPKRPSKTQVATMYASGEPVKTLARRCEVNVSSFYDWLTYYGIPRTRGRGEKHHTATLTSAEVRWAITRKGLQPGREVADMLGCSTGTILAIWRYEYRYIEALSAGKTPYEEPFAGGLSEGFLWPSDQSVADNEELGRVCAELELTLERYKHAVNLLNASHTLPTSAADFIEGLCADSN